MKKHLICLLLLVLAAGSAGAQKAVPMDPQVRIGKLQNGFTYYIRKNDVPAGEIFMELLVNAGNLYQDADQLELAHLLEHLGLRKTVHFPGGIINWSKDKGLNSMNAHTAGDYTRYYLAVPSDRPALFDEGLLVLRDWAQGLVLDPAQIDEERGVILGELRQGDSHIWRLYLDKKYRIMNNMLFHPSMSARTVEHINTFEHESVIRFYNDWYRPDLEAAMIVGDVDVDETERRLIALFSDLKMPAQPRKVEDFRARGYGKLLGKNQLILFADKAIPHTSLEINTKRPVQAAATDFDRYKMQVTDRIYEELMNARLNALIRKYNPPFVSVGHSMQRDYRMSQLDILYTHIRLKESTSVSTGFQSIFAEFERIKQLGFTPAELENARQAVLFENANTNRNVSEAHARRYISHYLNGHAAPDPAFETKLIRQLIEEIRLEEMNAMAREWLSVETNSDVVIETPRSESLPTEADIRNWQAEAKKTKMLPFRDGARPSALIPPAQLAKLSDQVKYTQTEKAGLVNLTLANGVKVVLKPFKPSGYQSDKILLEGFSPGGSLLYSASDQPSAHFASTLIVNSGMGVLDKFDLEDYLTGTTVSVQPFISARSESFSGSCSPRETEIMLQLVHQYFVAPNKNKDAFTDAVTTARSNNLMIDNAGNNFYTAITTTLNPELRRMDELDKIRFERAYEIYRERFANAGDFTFVITGNFEVDKIKPLVLKYLGNLPSIDRKETPAPYRKFKPTGKQSKNLYGGEESNSKVVLVYSGNYEYNECNNIVLDALSELLSVKLRDRLREKEAGTYHVSVRNNHDKFPTGSYHFLIDFVSAPDNVEKMIAAAQEEIAVFREQGPDAVSFRKMVALRKNEVAQDLESNAFWCGYLAKQLQEGNDLDAALNREALLNKLTIEDIKAAAVKYLSDDNFMRFVLLPDSMKQTK